MVHAEFQLWYWTLEIQTAGKPHHDKTNLDRLSQDWLLLMLNSTCASGCSLHNIPSLLLLGFIRHQQKIFRRFTYLQILEDHTVQYSTWKVPLTLHQPLK